MDNLFKPFNIGRLEVPNRILRSAAYENMCTVSGHVTPELIKMYTKLARGGVGLIITGFLYVLPEGKAAHKQTAVYSDEFIPGLKDLVNAVHDEGGLIAAELVHSGASTGKRYGVTTPMAPSGGLINPFYMNRSVKMTEDDIERTIKAFADAAHRAVTAGFDAVQLHAAHGYLINQFMSPFYNRRDDDWGGDEERRFRFMGEVVKATRKAVGKDYPLFIKLNTFDDVKNGLQLDEACRHAARLEELGCLDAVEISVGTTTYSPFAMARGDIPIVDLGKAQGPVLGKLAHLLRPFIGIYGKKYRYQEAFNMPNAREIRKVVKMPLIVVGGMKDPANMEKLLADGEGSQTQIDAVSMARPLIREPSFVNRIKRGDTRPSTCLSCNKCLATVSGAEDPLKCYSL